MPTKTERDELINWTTANSRSRVLVEGTAPSKRLQEHLWPMAEDYRSPLNPIFLSALQANEMNRVPLWLSRDGTVPLLWFFTKNPTPKGFAGRLLVHGSQEALVPRAWRERCGSYVIESIPRMTAPRKLRTKGLLITGLIMDTVCSLNHLDHVLEQISKLRLPSTAQTLLFLPTRHGGFGFELHHDFYANFMLKLSRKLGPQARAINWNELDGFGSFEGYLHVDLNDRGLCADPYTTHLALSKGAVMAFPERASTGSSRRVPLSPYHGMRVNPRLATRSSAAVQRRTNAKWEDVNRFYEAFRSPVNQRFPWPEWFSAYARSGQPDPAQSSD